MNEPEPAARRRGRPSSGGREAILEATLALLRERGVASLTSREVAARAGVSDASVYYHFKDREGLLQAVFEHGVKPLRFMEEEIEPAPRDLRCMLETALDSLEQFFDDVLPVLYQAQSDAGLAASLGDYVKLHDLGPHRGVAAVARYLRAEQGSGRVRAEVDPEAAALTIIDTAFARATRRLLLAASIEQLPSRERMIDGLLALLSG